MRKQLITIIVFGLSVLISSLIGGEPIKLPGATISGQWFMGYQYGDKGGNSVNVFNVKRGYIIIKKQITETISGRITPDISLDQEGDGRGDIELRLKYLYVKLKLPSVKIFTKPYIEFGLAHRPWLDFEEHMYRYRV